MGSRFRPRPWLSRIRDSQRRRVQLPLFGCAIGVAALLTFAGSALASEAPPCESAPRVPRACPAGQHRATDNLRDPRIGTDADSLARLLDQ